MRVHATRSIGLAAAVILAAAAGCSKSKDEPETRAEPAAVPATARPGGFEVTGGSPEAHQHFARALRALHSFWYDEATREFQAAIDADKSFAMAYWGLAMSMSQLLWGEDDAGKARAILARLPRPDRLSEREQAWIGAARALFGEDTALAGRRRFAAAMEDLHRRFPDDESATVLSIALQATLHPGHPDEAAIRERAGALAAEVFARSPDHPGAAHYLIHAYDTPGLAARALPAAQRYAAIAPEAFHAQHMPAHIFARLGKWKEALASCQAAWDASIAAARRHKLGADHHDYHSLTWLVEINFELGRRSQADAAFAKYADAIKAGLGPKNRLTYVSQVGSYLARTGEWKRIDELLAPLAAASTDGGGAAAPAVPPAAEGAPGASSCHAPAAAPADSPMAMFEKRAILTVRARAAAARHDLAGVQKLIGGIEAIDGELRPFLERSQPAELVAMQDEVNRLARRALVARARRDQRDLLATLRQLEAADRSPPGEGMPDAFIRKEGIADALLATGDAAAALGAYQEVLRDHPGRASAMLGAARAAKKAGEAERAREWYRKLIAQWSEAEAKTEGLAEARAAVR
jgi:tetratricopeptide (TPR) repeat protein